jgi:hypothetical protein
MNKLIKVSETHYVIIDDSEKIEGDLVFCLDVHYNNPNHPPEMYINPIRKRGGNDNCNSCKKITHSTEKLNDVIILDLFEIYKVVYGYDINKISVDKFNNITNNKSEYNKIKHYWCGGFKHGIREHKELTKDKIFTIEDIRKVIIMSATSNTDNLIDRCEEIISLIQLKTEWNISIDENNKIVLL